MRIFLALLSLTEWSDEPIFSAARSDPAPRPRGPSLFAHAEGVEFRYLASQEDALRGLGVCDPSAHLPWLVVRNGGDIYTWATRHWDGRTDGPGPSELGGDARVNVSQWNYFHIPKCAGTSLIAALEDDALASGLEVLETCVWHA